MENNEPKTIHEFDFELICDYFSTLERQGPGSREATLRALGFVGESLTAQSLVADLGCGTGGQTVTLAQNTAARIVGIDLFAKFTGKLNANARKLGLDDRLTAQTASMDNLPFAPESLDGIWCEGAIYNIGFERGLREWRPLLKPHAFVAATEASWFTDERPAAIEAFWREAYAGIDTIPNKIAQMQRCGYELTAAFALPETCWTDNFYAPQAEAQRLFLERHPHNATARELVANQRREADMYARYHRYYGYVFYIGRKTA